MGQYRKKPIVVEAWQWTPPEVTDMPRWLMDAIEDSTCCCHSRGEAADMVVTINTLEGMMTAQPDDWIIQGVKGEIYPCKPDVFAATYEPAETERLPDVDTSDIPETSAEWFEKASHFASKVEAMPQMPPGVRVERSAGVMQTGPATTYAAEVEPIGPGPEVPSGDYHHPSQRATRFRDEMQQVINSHSRENGSDTPDFILAQYILDVMDAFDKAVTRRSEWYKPARPIYNRITELEVQLSADGEHTAAGQAEIERLNAENAQLRGELQRVSMAGLTPSMVVGK